VLYLVEQGATLRKQGERLVVEGEGEILASVPAVKVEQVVVFGSVQLTTPAMVHLLRSGVDVAFLSVDGRYYGRLVSAESQFGELRLRHLRLVEDGERALELARAMVRAKLHNCRTLLQRAQRERPPPDPVNVLLSFGYTLLAQAIQAAVQTVGLDPYVGFLHVPAYSRPSLVLDLMEEFRPVVVDSVVLRLVNARILTRADFVEQPEVAERPVALTDEARRRFIAAFEERVQTRVTEPREGRQVTVRRLFELQARQVAAVALGQRERYEPWLIR